MQIVYLHNVALTCGRGPCLRKGRDRQVQGVVGPLATSLFRSALPAKQAQAPGWARICHHYISPDRRWAGKAGIRGSQSYPFRQGRPAPEPVQGR